MIHRLRLAALFSLLASLPPLSPAFAQRREGGIRDWRPVHFDVALAFSDQLDSIATARAEVTVETLRDGVREVDLDFGSMDVASVSVDGRPCRFTRKPGRLNVAIDPPAPQGRRFVVAIGYHGRPADGLILGPDEDGRPSATADNWPDRVHHWIPCLDHPSAKATARFTVAAPERDIVVADGVLESSSTQTPGMRTWTYSEASPIPAYCMMIAAGEYAASRADASAVTAIDYYAPASMREAAAAGFATAAPALDFYQRTVAPFPYEKLALIVGASSFSGMEFPSAIAFSGSLFARKAGREPMSNRLRIPERLEVAVAHEIAHQWFGDSVTEASWSDLWLSEGFATYFAGLFLESYEGPEAFRAYMRDAAAQVVAYEKTRRPPLHDETTPKIPSLLNADAYQKGAWVLHMLRRRLGDDAFFAGIRAYYAAHRGANATAEDLRAGLERSSGRDLKAFFGRWVYGAGHPIYRLSSKWNPDRSGRGRLALTLRQLQREPPFTDPVVVEIVTASGKTRTTLRPVGRTASARLDLAAEPVAVRLAPDNALLDEIAAGDP